MPSIAELKKEIEAAEVNVATLGLRYRERHPKMIQAQSQLMESKAALVSNVLKVPPQIRATYETALANESRLEAALKEQEQLALELNQQAIPYNVLARDVETDRAVYESTLKRLKEVDIAKGIESGNYRIFEAARLPLSPVGAKKLRVIALSLLGGLLVGVALSIGLYMMDTSFRSVEQAEALTGLPVVGAIPYWSRSEQSKNALALVDEPDSNVAEAFRSLRTMLAVSENGQGDKALLFTSALKEEGKSFCAVNYAIGLAQQQLRTIIVDADLRRPKVAEMLCRKDPGVGLADHLAGKAKLEKVIYPTLVEGLSVLPAGSALPNPAELLSGGGFSRLLKELSKSFDRIIIDTAPLNLVGDALLVVQHCKSVCLVMRAGKTPRKSVRRACEMLSRAGLTNLSLVLNQLYASPGLAKYYRYDSGAPIYGASYARRDSAKV
jgi:capsular exopolysaccharide synthesis family protein